MTYDPTKEYQTHDGREVMLLPELDYTGALHGMYRDETGDWCLSAWDGVTLQARNRGAGYDLVEKPKTHVRWLHLVEKPGSQFFVFSYHERLPAGDFPDDLIAVKRIEIAEGEGLEDD